jgi:hypothetical protein
MIADLLRRPGDVAARCSEPASQADIAKLDLVLIVLCGALFGAAIGTYRGGLQIAFSAVKIPAATLVTLALCGPGFAVLGTAFGRRWTLRQTLALALTAGARSSLVLFALTPVLWLMINLGTSYDTVRLFAVGAYGLAGLSGLLFLLRGIGPSPGRAATIASFLSLFFLVGAQTAWLLRPYLGDPHDADVPLFAQGRREGGLVGALLRSAGLGRDWM